MSAIEIVSASAGSGKTYRLVEVLVKAITHPEAPVRPEAVIATTFTVKAASELRERVRLRLLEHGLVAEAQRTYAKASVAMTATVSVASKKDWRAAAFVLQHRQGDPKARHDEKRARYEAEVAKNRAAGTHVETVRHVGELTDDELRAEAQRILRGDADADEPRTTH